MSMSSGGGKAAVGMGGMDMTSFSFTTDVTLFFAGWRTNTPAKYFGTLVFTFFLTILNRFLGAWRSQLSHTWANQAAVARAENLRRRRARQRRRSSDRLLRSSMGMGRPSLSGEPKPELEPFTPLTSDSANPPSPTDHLEDEMAASKEEQLLASLGPRWTRFLGSRWIAANPWTLRLDVPRALMEGLRALIGYLLMLAVMTFNAGFFITIILGVIVGELVLGRFMGGDTAREEGTCHDG